MQFKPPTPLDSKFYRFFVGNIGDGPRHQEAIFTGNEVYPAYRQHLGTILFGHYQPHFSLAHQHRRTFIANRDIGVYLDHDGAVAERGFSNHSDHIHILLPALDDGGGRSAVRRSRSRADAGDKRPSDGLYRVRSHNLLHLCKWMERGDPDEPSPTVSVTLASPHIPFPDPAADWTGVALFGSFGGRHLMF